MSYYQEVSASIRAIFHRYTDIIEPLSLDEAYLDVSEVDLFKGSGTLIAVASIFSIVFMPVYPTTYFRQRPSGNRSCKNQEA